MPSAFDSLPRLLQGLALPALPEIIPKRLFTRTLIIIAAPVVLLLSILTIVTMERHLERVTQQLSAATAKNIGMLLDLYEEKPRSDDTRRLIARAADRVDLKVDFLPHLNLPTVNPQHYFSLLDRALGTELGGQVSRPFWLNTLATRNEVEIRILLPQEVMRILVLRKQTYASKSHVFFAWMLGSSSVLLIVASMFLRNQIRPILQLADAAERFGKGLPPPEGFRPRGALEVRKASLAFLRMRDRIERHVEQRTTMLAAISHDLRTVLTRLKLELALSPDTSETAGMRKDVEEMQNMVNAYLEFARGEGDEETALVPIDALLADIAADMGRMDSPIAVRSRRPELAVALRRNAFKRALTNLVVNATRHARRVEVATALADDSLLIHVDDDGPGIPLALREQVFQPFFRIDDARSQSNGASTGLGLSIARDVVHSHGGSLSLSDSPLGGLRATIKVPL